MQLDLCVLSYLHVHDGVRLQAGDVGNDLGHEALQRSRM